MYLEHLQGGKHRGTPRGRQEWHVTCFGEDSSLVVSSGFKRQVFGDLPQKRGYGFSSCSSQQRRNGVWVQKDLLKQKGPHMKSEGKLEEKMDREQ